MIELELEIPLWKALHQTFKKFGSEGWGITGPPVLVPDAHSSSEVREEPEGRLRQTVTTRYGAGGTSHI